jgi:hypothetical protein
MIPMIFFSFGENAGKAPTVPPDFRVDAGQPRPYIGGGPRLPNEALSFWKE